MRDDTQAFSQTQGIFHYFRAFKTKILRIYSLIGQILKQLSPLVTSTSGDNCILFVNLYIYYHLHIFCYLFLLSRYYYYYCCCCYYYFLPAFRAFSLFYVALKYKVIPTFLHDSSFQLFIKIDLKRLFVLLRKI